MSIDYALFIIIVPNDFDAENSIVPTTLTANVNKQELRKTSVDTVSALMAPAAIPLLIPPANIPFNGKNSEHDLSLSHEQPYSMSICVILRNYLAEKSEVEALWMLSDNKKKFQITFYVEFGYASDHMLQDLAELSIGEIHDTKIFVLPTTLVLTGRNNEENRSLSSLDLTENMNNISDNKSLPIKEEGDINDSPSNDLTLSRKIRKRINESDFKKSVRARLMVHQVAASIKASSAISFDFVLLICLASMLAALGLLENSTVIIVASMLVSPLMNPILGIVFGLSVRDHPLWRRGLKNEILGLIICISCGFFMGLFTTVFETKWGSSKSFPTSEMKSRGDVKRLWVGVLIALPSGAGVALSVLGGNTGSLVGVAISASLLPPAVNCGLLFAYALLGKIFSNVATIHSPILNNTSRELYSTSNCAKYIDNDYLPLYTCNLTNEAAILSCCSLLLTIVNIICIIIMALFIFRIKEVAPLHQPNKDIANFFHHDVKVARDYNKTIHEGDFDVKNLATSTLHRNNIAQSIVNRWKTFTSLASNDNQQQQSELPSPSSINTDLESTENKNIVLPEDMESRRKLFRVKTFAKEYDLDIFNKDDCNLTSRGSRDKVCLLISDLIDMCQEVPEIFVDLYRLQPSGTQSASADKENMSFYQEIIELLPPKWHQLFVYEKKRRHITSWPLTSNRSYSMRSPPLETYNSLVAEPKNHNLHDSLKKQNKKDKARFTRQASVPESTCPSTTVHQETETPVQGTRFRIAKPSTPPPDTVENEAIRI